MESVPQCAQAAAAGAPPVTLEHEACAADPSSPLLMTRVGRLLQDLAADREVSDEEILQHAKDCTVLMESSYGRFMAYEDVAAREEAYVWMHRRDEAMRRLSPAWKAAREAQIQQRIAEDTGCYFTDMGERDRAAMQGGRA